MATRLPRRSCTLLIAPSRVVTSAVHSGREYTYTDLMGLPLILATSAAEPALEPKSIEPALRNCSALDEELVCTHRTVVPSLASACSRKPFCLSSIETGL